jgi:dihydroorotate dehydrogenase (fumarate)
LLDGLRRRLEEKGYGSIGQVKGILSQRNCPDPSAFERANYIKTVVGSTPFREELGG